MSKKDSGKSRPDSVADIGRGQGKRGWIPGIDKRGFLHDHAQPDAGVTDRGKDNLKGHHYPGRRYPHK